MAPVIADKISDLHISSNELDVRSIDLAEYLSALPLDEREALMKPSSSSLEKRSLEIGTETLHSSEILSIRDAPRVTGTPNYSGAINPSDINMKGIQALFALIGVSFVLGIIWFFFWAKNGGFRWRKGDWDEYKSTVLRRRGPNGTTLSNATKSTKLGGGSIVGDGYSDRDTLDETGTIYTGTMTELSSSTAPIIKDKQKARKQKKGNAREQKQREMSEARFEGGHDDDVRAYMKEKPARVGGINRDSEALHYGTDYTDTEPSVAHSQSRPQREQPRTARNNSPDKRASRRDFSYTVGGDQAFSTASQSERAPSPPPMRVPATSADQPPRPPTHTTPRASRYHPPPKQAQPPPRQAGVPGGYAPSSSGTASSYGYTEPLDFSTQRDNTKSYHHPIPGLNGGRAGGFRRDRGGDELDE